VSRPPVVLGIETSCDETSAAVLRGERELLGHVVFTQDVHRIYGGVVPELASRAHLRTVDDVVSAALGEAGVRWRAWTWSG
jgi:N6-L-threonylcarbamoyladenine synthase